MPPNSTRLGAASFSQEATWGAIAATSFTNRFPLVGQIDVSGLTWEKMDIGYTRQRQNDFVAPVRGIKGGSFRVRAPLTGYGATTVGGVSESVLADILGLFVGNNRASDTDTTFDGNGTAASPDVAALTVGSGTLIRAGALGDGRGNGQFAAVANSGGSTVNLLTALDDVPNNGDVLYPAEIVHPSEGPTATGVTSTRWLLQTADQQYRCWGCYPMSLNITGLNPGELPMVEMEFGVSHWDAAATDTFPNATAADDFPVAPVAAGSFFLNAVGTATRVLKDIRSFDLSINMEVIPITGPGSGDAYTIVRSARRVRCQAEFNIVLDSEAAGTDTPGDEWDADTTFRHALYTLSGSDGSAVGFYFPKIIQVGNKPVQTDVEGLNRKQLTYRAATGPTTTSELLASNWRMALA